jgi:hypothetical protein
MAKAIQGLPEADRKVEDGDGVGLEGSSRVGEIYGTNLARVAVAPRPYCLLKMITATLVCKP